MIEVEEFIKDVTDEVGFKFGTPWRYSEKALGVVVPILRQGVAVLQALLCSRYGERVYITLEEALKQGVKFKDTGSINKIIVETKVDKPIFIRTGTALDSKGTQPRAVETSVVIIPGKEQEVPAARPSDVLRPHVQPTPVPVPQVQRVTVQEVPVKCVHASRPICTMGTFTYAGLVPETVEKQLLHRRSQSDTWAAVSGYARTSEHRFEAAGFRAETREHLIGVMKEVSKFTANLEEVLKQVPLFEDQVGLVIFDLKDVSGLELFDHPKSWEAIHKEIERRFGEVIGKEQETLFKPDYQAIKPLTLAFLKKLLESEKKEIAKYNGASTISLIGEEVIGEATTINGKVIHLIGLRAEIRDKEKYREVTDRHREMTDEWARGSQRVRTLFQSAVRGP